MSIHLGVTDAQKIVKKYENVGGKDWKKLAKLEITAILGKEIIPGGDATYKKYLATSLNILDKSGSPSEAWRNIHNLNDARIKDTRIPDYRIYKDKYQNIMFKLKSEDKLAEYYRYFLEKYG